MTLVMNNRAQLFKMNFDFELSRVNCYCLVSSFSSYINFYPHAVLISLLKHSVSISFGEPPKIAMIIGLGGYIASSISSEGSNPVSCDRVSLYTAFHFHPPIILV